MNTELLARYLEKEMSTVPAGSGSLGQVMRKGRRRRWARRLVAGVGVLVVAFLFVMFPIPYDPNPMAIAGSFEIPAAVEVSDLEVAVESDTPVSESPVIWLGWKHPTPEFDTTDLGPDRTFAGGSPSADDLVEGKALAAVYLGEYEGRPFYIYAQAPPSIYDRVFEIASGNLSGEILGTSHGCC